MIGTPDRRLDILLVTQNFAPEPTGIGKYSGEMAAWLARRGHRVEVIAAVPHYPEWRVSPEYVGRGLMTEQVDGATVHRVPVYLPHTSDVSTRTRLLLETSFNVASSCWWLPRFVSGSRPDALIVVCPPTQAMLWPLLYSAVCRVPVVVHFQDLQVDAAVSLGMIRNDRAGRALFRLESWLMGRASHVTTISGAMLDRIRAKGVAMNRTSLFPNWSRLDEVKPGPPDPEVRARLGASPDDVLFVYAGSVGEKQGLDVLLRAAQQLARERTFRFAIVGNGANRQELERHALALGVQNVTFSSLFPVADLRRLLTAADVHLVIQRREAADLVMPSKLTNILASGRPCIATADADTELGRVLRSADCGVLVPPDDDKALADAMLELASDPLRRSSLGLRARDYALRELDEDTVLTRFESLLREVIKAG